MGNCVQSGSGGIISSHGATGEEGRLVQRPQRRRRRRSSGRGEEEEGDRGSAAPPTTSVVKVKMVLTKGELGRLVARLKAGGGRLEDVLQEMSREGPRAGGGGWRPGLESIAECPAETPAAASSDDD